MIPRGIIIHHSATVDGRTFSWQQIRKYHMSYRIDNRIVSKEEFYRRLEKKDGRKFEKPWRDIGYHAGIELIEDHYEVLIGRPLYMMGAHCKGYNDYIGFCFIGNWDIKEPEYERLEYAITHFIVPVIRMMGFSVGDIYYHRNFAKKTCPGRLFPDLYDFRRMVSHYLVKENLYLAGEKMKTWIRRWS